jgi:hypothetical protein
MHTRGIASFPRARNFDHKIVHFLDPRQRYRGWCANDPPPPWYGGCQSRTPSPQPGAQFDPRTIAGSSAAT